jgi:S-adenosylmethionine hydrolase
LGGPLKESAIPKVHKSGSVWSGQVVLISEEGNVVTNFLSEDVLPLATSSKLWFEFGPEDKPQAVRGIAAVASDVVPQKIFAIAGSSGFIELTIQEGNAARVTGLRVSSPVILRFRV